MTAAIAPSTAAKFRSRTVCPRLPYVLAIESLMAAIAASVGRMSVSAKKHVCSTVFTLRPRPASDAIESASMTWTANPLSMIWRWASTGMRSQVPSGPNGLLISSVPPAAAERTTSIFSSSPNWWHPTNSASCTR